jgi:hypothetical protein
MTSVWGGVIALAATGPKINSPPAATQIATMARSPLKIAPVAQANGGRHHQQKIGDRRREHLRNKVCDVYPRT